MEVFNVSTNCDYPNGVYPNLYIAIGPSTESGRINTLGNNQPNNTALALQGNLNMNGWSILNSGGGGGGSTPTSVIWQATGTPASGYVIGDSSSILSYLIANPTVNTVYCNDQNGTQPLIVDTVLNLNIGGSSPPYVCLVGWSGTISGGNTAPSQLNIVGPGQIINPFALTYLSIYGVSNSETMLVYDTTISVNMAVSVNTCYIQSQQASPYITCVDGGSVIMYWNNSIIGSNSFPEGNVFNAATTNLVILCNGNGNISQISDAFAFSNNSGNIQVLTDSSLQIPLVNQTAVTGSYSVNGPLAIYEIASDPTGYVNGQVAYPSIGPTVQDFLNKLTSITPDSIIWAAGGFIGDNNYIVGDSSVVSTYLNNNPDTKIVYVDDSQGPLSVDQYLNLNGTCRLIGRNNGATPPIITCTATPGEIIDPLGLEWLTIYNNSVVNNGQCVLYNAFSHSQAYQKNVTYVYNTALSSPFVYVGGGSQNPFTLYFDNVIMPVTIGGAYPWSMQVLSSALTLVVNNSTLGTVTTNNFFNNTTPDFNSTINIQTDSNSVVPLVTQLAYNSTTYTINGGQAWQINANDPNSYLSPGAVTYPSLGKSVQDMLNQLTTITIDSGTATLSDGSILVNSTLVQSNSAITVTYNTFSASSVGALSVPTGGRTVGVSFTINSSGTADNSTVDWILVNS